MHMTMPTPRFRAGETSSARGFTLVELMIAMAVSLIVALAAVGFVVSLIKANSENLKVTRLTQELRALSEVMGREIRRARYVADPVGLIATAGTINRDAITINAVADCDATPVPTGANCIVFSYDEPPDGVSPGVTVSRSFWLDGTTLRLNPAPIVATPCAGGSRISTPEVRITNLCLERNNSEVRIVVAGELANSPPGLAGVSRTFSQTTYVRSGQVN